MQKKAYIYKFISIFIDTHVIAAGRVDVPKVRTEQLLRDSFRTVEIKRIFIKTQVVFIPTTYPRWEFFS